jgi:hypothetical protein
MTRSFPEGGEWQADWPRRSADFIVPAISPPQVSANGNVFFRFLWRGLWF